MLFTEEVCEMFFRREVILENVERYKKIEKQMKKGIGVKKFDQNSAVKYLRGL